MALPSSGSLSIKGAAGAGRSISMEVDGNETGSKSLSTLSTTAGKTANHSMVEFYSYDSVPPNGVLSVTATVGGAGNNDVTVSWSPSGSGGTVTQFRIEIFPAATAVWTYVADVAAGGSNSYVDNDRVSDQYTYRVRAEGTGGNSAYVESNTITVGP